jgi:hypothetical protein
MWPTTPMVSIQLGVTLAEFFAPFDKTFKPESRKRRKDWL